MLLVILLILTAVAMVFRLVWQFPLAFITAVIVVYLAGNRPDLIKVPEQFSLSDLIRLPGPSQAPSSPPASDEKPAPVVLAPLTTTLVIPAKIDQAWTVGTGLADQLPEQPAPADASQLRQDATYAPEAADN